MHYDKYLFLKIKEYLNYHEYCGSLIKTKVWLCDKFLMFYIVPLQDVEVMKAQVV
jgi:hypothetical protein